MLTVLLVATLFDEGERPTGPPPAAAQVAGGNGATGEARSSPLSQSTGQKAARLYRHKIWEVHKYLGFGLCVLLLSRLAIETRRQKSDRLITRINRAVNIPVSTEAEKNEKLHFLLSKWGYVVFYVLLLLMAVTGLVLAFEDAAFLKPVHGLAKDVHEVLQYAMYAYVAAHLAGVIRSEFKNQRGIVSAMINGGNEELQ